MSKTFSKRKAEDEFDIARTRSSLYNLLACLYGKEPDLRFLRQMRNPDFIQLLSGLGVEFEKDFLERPEKELIDKLAVEYTRLFIGPGKHISPHESVHRDGEGLLWGDSTVKVKTFIEASGLKYHSDFKGIPDHISVELEFMHRLVEAEAEARKKNDQAKLEKILNIEQRFMAEHMSKWLPLLADRIIKETQINFYQKMAILTKEFILLETEELSKAP